ncbi:MAG: sigma-54 dependent transcriptional regulator, partial [Bdellovibrionota bacterium]
MARILVIDDEKSIRDTLELYLSEKGHEVFLARTAEEGIELAARERPALLITDNKMPGKTGLEALPDLLNAAPEAFVVMVTAHGDMETTIHAMKGGAHEFLAKPLDIQQLDIVLAKALGLSELRARLADAEAVRERHFDTQHLVGKTPAMQAIFKTIGQVAGQNVTVLITGESGTGKELIARALHENSPRAGRPFVAVNCTALAETLLESELFGHEKGAFTDAHAARAGKFEAAAGGTLFLDEIGEISPAIQVKLLRALQEKTIERVGGNRPIKIDLRIVAATNRDLPAEVKAGRFREDLYYRLKVVEVHVPPLRERLADLPLLVEHLLGKINAELHTRITQVTERAMDQLKAYSWPGNVRELENVLTTAAVR